MTQPAPIRDRVPAPPPSVGPIGRWRLTEPVRLYLWPVAVLLLAAGITAGLRDGDWVRAGLGLAFAVLVWSAAEAARASVGSPRFMVQATMRARQQ